MHRVAELVDEDHLVRVARGVAAGLQPDEVRLGDGAHGVVRLAAEALDGARRQAVAHAVLGHVVRIVLEAEDGDLGPALDELRGDVRTLLGHHVHDARRHVQRVGLDDLAALDADAVARGGEARVVRLVGQGVAAVIVNGAVEKVADLARHAHGDVLRAGRVDRIDEADRGAVRLLLVDRAKVPRHVARPMHERQHATVEYDLEVALVVGMMDLRVPVELDAAGVDEARVEDLGRRARVGEAVHGIPFTWARGARDGPAPAACRRGGRCGRACSA